MIDFTKAGPMSHPEKSVARSDQIDLTERNTEGFGETGPRLEISHMDKMASTA